MCHVVNAIACRVHSFNLLWLYTHLRSNTWFTFILVYFPIHLSVFARRISTKIGAVSFCEWLSHLCMFFIQFYNRTYCRHCTCALKLCLFCSIFAYKLSYVSACVSLLGVWNKWYMFRTSDLADAGFISICCTSSVSLLGTDARCLGNDTWPFWCSSISACRSCQHRNSLCIVDCWTEGPLRLHSCYKT